MENKTNRFLIELNGKRRIFEMYDDKIFIEYKGDAPINTVQVIAYDEYEKLQDKIYHLTREIERIEYEKSGYETMFNELKQENEILKSKV